MRFLATGDIQCHAWRQFSYTRKDGMNSRLYNCLQVFEIILKEAEERGINKVLLNGDIFEENAYINVEVYDAVYRKIEKLHRHGLEVVINLGNHDMLKESGKRVLHSLRAFRTVATVIEKPTLVWGTLQVVPWTSDIHGFKKTIAGFRRDKECALVLHCGVQGATTGPTSYLVRNPIKLKDVRPNEFAAVILSDYHTRQRLAKNVFYLGSPLQHSFGETHRPCIWEMHLDGRSFVSKKIYTNLPLFRKIRMERASDLRKKLETLSSNYVAIVIPASSNLSDEEIEHVVRGRFQFRIERKEDELDSEQPENVHTLAPEEAISQYTGFHSSGKSIKRLNQLGQSLYAGKEEV